MATMFLVVKGTPKQVMDQISRIIPEKWEQLKNSQVQNKGGK